jgi:hypothetical protein
VDVCADVPGAAALQDGLWHGTLARLGNEIDPTYAGCTGLDAAGPDALFNVVLAPGETFQATLPDGLDQQLYLVSDCADAATCAAGDVALGGPAQVVYTNNAAATESWVLVLDSGGDLPTPVYRVDVLTEQRTALTDADTCADAGLLAALGSGSWAGGDLTLGTDALDPGVGGCTSDAMPGPDAMLPVHLEDGELISIRATGVDALYTVTDCLDAATCTDASTLWASEPHLLVGNQTGAPWDGFVVGDNATLGAPWTLDVVLANDEAFAPEDTCAAAASLSPWGTGSWHGLGDLGGFTDTLDPGAGGCTGFSASGQEGILPVVLADGETLSAVANQLGGDGALYLLSDCSDVLSCVAGDDQIGGSGDWPEALTYTNTSGASETRWLVLDGFLATGPFYLSLDIQ